MPCIHTPRTHIEQINLANNVTTNTTIGPTNGVPDAKTFWAEVVGTGAVSCTVKIWGSRKSTYAANTAMLLSTLTPSDTTEAVDAAAVSLATYPYYFVTTESISGTGATVRVEVFY
jgi:hypothetical protein